MDANTVKSRLTLKYAKAKAAAPPIKAIKLDWVALKIPGNIKALRAAGGIYFKNLLKKGDGSSSDNTTRGSIRGM